MSGGPNILSAASLNALKVSTISDYDGPLWLLEAGCSALLSSEELPPSESWHHCIPSENDIACDPSNDTLSIMAMDASIGVREILCMHDSPDKTSEEV